MLSLRPIRGHCPPRDQERSPSRGKKMRAVHEALALWEDRERRRIEILTMVDESQAYLARGEGREITEDSMSELAKQTEERLRRRIGRKKIMHRIVRALCDAWPEK
jgi:hypothetical protein